MDEKKDFEEAKEAGLKLLPFIPIFFTLIGSMKVYFQYRKYGINIFEYIELNEILTLFLSDTYLYIFPAGAIYIINVFDTDFNFEFLKYDIKEASLKGFIKWILVQFPVMAVILFLLAMIRSELDVDGSVTGKYIVPTIDVAISINLFFIGVKAYMVVTNYLRENYRPITFSVYRFYFLTVALTSCITFMYTFKEYNSRKHDNKNFGTYIKTENNTYNMDNKLILIGRIKNYAFIFNETDKCTEVIPVNEIKEYNLKVNSW